MTQARLPQTKTGPEGPVSNATRRKLRSQKEVPPEKRNICFTSYLPLEIG